MSHRFAWTFALAASILLAVAAGPRSAAAESDDSQAGADPPCLLAGAAGCELPLPGWLQALMPKEDRAATARAPLVIDLPGLRTCIGDPASVMMPPWLGGERCDVRIPVPNSGADDGVRTARADSAKRG